MITKKKGLVALGLIFGYLYFAEPALSQDTAAEVDKLKKIVALQQSTIKEIVKNNSTFSGDKNFSGKVGVGTSSPKTNFHIHKGTSGAAAGDFGLLVENDDNASIEIASPASKKSMLLFSPAGNETDGKISYNGSEATPPNAMQFATGDGNPKMTIDSTGNVGIGTTAAQGKLHVHDFKTPSIVSNEFASMSGGASGQAVFGSNMHWFWDGSAAPHLRYSQSRTNHTAGGFVVNYPTTGYQSIISSGTTSSTANQSFTPVVRMTIDNEGKVGIGTPNPNANLHIQNTHGLAKLKFVSSSGSTADADDLVIREDFLVGSNANHIWSNINYILGVARNDGSPITTEANMLAATKFVVSKDGNVGIGTSTPFQGFATSANFNLMYQQGLHIHATNPHAHANLSIEGTDAATIWLAGRSSGTDLKSSVIQNLNGKTKFMVARDTGTVKFDKVFVIDHDTGNIGIGTVNPERKLHVYTDGYNEALIQGRSASLRLLNFSSSNWIQSGRNNDKTSVADLYFSGMGGSPIHMIIKENGDIMMPRVYHRETSNGSNMYIHSDGSLYRTSSSIRYKKNIDDLADDESNSIYDLRPVTYEAKTRVDDNHQRYLGLIAEEVDSVAPMLVHYDKDNRPNDVQYAKIAVLLVAEAKKFKKKIDQLKTENNNLKTRVKSLENTNQHLIDYLCTKDPEASFCED